MKNVLISSAILSTLFAVSANAATSPNWTFVEAAYITVDVDDVLSPSGFGLKGSFAINETFFVNANYSIISDDVTIFNTKIDTEMSELGLGLGYNYSVNSTTDLFGIISYESVGAEASAGGFSEDETFNGFGLSAGIRSMVSEQFELGGSLNYITIDSESDTGFELNAYYHFNEQFSAGASYGSSGDVSTMTANVRYSF